MGQASTATLGDWRAGTTPGALAGLASLAVIVVALALVVLGVTGGEVVATLLFAPVFAVGLLAGRRAGYGAAAGATVAYLALRGGDLSGAGLASAGVMVLTRAAAYAVAGHVGALVRVSLDPSAAGGERTATAAGGRARAEQATVEWQPDPVDPTDPWASADEPTRPVLAGVGAQAGPAGVAAEEARYGDVAMTMSGGWPPEPPPEPASEDGPWPPRAPAGHGAAYAPGDPPPEGGPGDPWGPVAPADPWASDARGPAVDDRGMAPESWEREPDPPTEDQWARPDDPAPPDPWAAPPGNSDGGAPPDPWAAPPGNSDGGAPPDPWAAPPAPDPATQPPGPSPWSGLSNDAWSAASAPAQHAWDDGPATGEAPAVGGPWGSSPSAPADRWGPATGGADHAGAAPWGAPVPPPAPGAPGAPGPLHGGGARHVGPGAPPEPPRLPAVDPETGLWTAQFLRDRLTVERARSRRSGHPCSLVLVQVPDGPLAQLPYRRQVTLLRELGYQFVAGGVVDHMVHVPDQQQHWFAVIMPDTDHAGAQVLERRLRLGIGGYLASRGLPLRDLQSASLTSPDDDAAMGQIWDALIGPDGDR